MGLLFCNVAALAVAFLYFFWRTYNQARQARERVLRERVAYMLWVMAGRIESGSRQVYVVRPG